MSPSAPEAYKDMLRGRIAPLLRGLGLRGSGSTYSMPWLMPAGVDTWWWVRRDQATDAVAAEVIEAIDAHALPAMRRQMKNV